MADQTKPNNAHVEQRLREEPTIWFTTVRADGRPHTVPVWFLWDGETFLIFSKPGTLKIRNVQRNPSYHACLGWNKAGNGCCHRRGGGRAPERAVTQHNGSCPFRKICLLDKSDGSRPRAHG